MVGGRPPPFCFNQARPNQLLACLHSAKENPQTSLARSNAETLGVARRARNCFLTLGARIRSITRSVSCYYIIQTAVGWASHGKQLAVDGEKNKARTCRKSYPAALFTVLLRVRPASAGKSSAMLTTRICLRSAFGNGTVRGAASACDTTMHAPWRRRKRPRKRSPHTSTPPRPHPLVVPTPLVSHQNK